MKRLLYLVLFALAVCLSANAAVSQRFDTKSVSSNKHKAIQKHVKKYKSYKFDRSSFLDNLKKDRHVKMNLAGDYDFDMMLEENNLCAAGCVVECTGKNGSTKKQLQSRIYKGKTSKGEDVRLSVFSNKVSMVIVDENGKETFVKQAKELTGEDDEELIVYQGGDLQVEEDVLYGNANDAIYVNLPSRPVIAYDNIPCAKMLELAVDVDYEFYKQKGYSVQNVYDEVLSALNLAELAYENYFSLTFCINYIHIWTSDQASNYPYSSSYSITTMLYNFRDYWNANQTNISRDLCHLFSGNPVGLTVGIAWCSPGNTVAGTSSGYSMSLLRDDMYKTTTHELGHNLGAQDANKIGYSSECECGTSNASVMCQGTKSNNQWFCDISVQQIQSGLAYGNTLFSLPANLNVTGTLSGLQREYNASSLLSATCKVTNSSNIKFVSFNKITLGSGFRVYSNSKFHGKIKSCGASLRKGSFLSDGSDEYLSDQTEDGSSNEGFSIYPNPTDGAFTVAFATEDVDFVLSVTDIAGKVIYTTSGTGREQLVDLEGKASGVYFVRVTVDDRSYVEKVILK